MKIKKNKRNVMVAAISILVIIAASAFSPSQKSTDRENNLKILPKDISHDELSAVMKSFQVALGVGCDACHAKSTDKPGKLDFAADHKNKEIALNMMRMTSEINKDYFDVPGDFKDNYLYQEFPVTCNSCHNGHEKPVQRISVPINYDELER
ncbi:c-type cytochrome [Membranicola marinus]|uniref:Photosynthetic reaction center cytochrome c subunit n=1 Tax=Membranihabitans marinus TaxID=1227546 RepID=A0A953HVW5_9BACT|nr:c-type cytochrome [Membranihabitans marinus]MBY5956747.1 c-type cytochrome [Membranihabitans marinus]